MTDHDERIVTRIGWFGDDDFRHFGHSLYNELVGTMSFLGFASLAVTGELPTKEDVLLLDDIAAGFQCPDARVWPTKLTRVAASNGRFFPGMIASWGAVVSGIGVPIAEACAHMLLDLESRMAASSDPDQALRDFVASRPGLPGFWVYARRVDERIGALRASVKRHGRSDRPMWSLSERLWAAMEQEHGQTPAIWGGFAAAFLDLGFTPAQMPPLLALFFQPSLIAHTIEAARLKSPAMRTFPIERVKYVGAAPRVSPRAAKSR